MMPLLNSFSFGSPHSGSASVVAENEIETEPELDVQIGDILPGNASRYQILDIIGEGIFGIVTKCVDLHTSKNVALKIIKDDEDGEREVNILDIVGSLDATRANVVEFYGSFEHKGHTCLAFELLDRNLSQLLVDRKYKALSLNEIRPIAHQLLTALDVLRKLNIIHSDVKLENIMLVDHQNRPFRVKLIDFGLSLKNSEAFRGMKIQPKGYRAPEVILGHSISMAVDMWALGCLLYFLYLNGHLFGGYSEYQTIRSIVEILGQPSDDFLNEATETEMFFNRRHDGTRQKWSLKTPLEYQKGSGTDPEKRWACLWSLNELFPPTCQPSVEMDDHRTFVILLRRMLQIDPAGRITPREALKHPFLTLSHMDFQKWGKSYIREALNLLDYNGFDPLRFISPTSTSNSRNQPYPIVSSQVYEQSQTEDFLYVDLTSPHSSDDSVNLLDSTAPMGSRYGSAQHPAVFQDTTYYDVAVERLAVDVPPSKGATGKKKKKSLMKRISTLISWTFRSVFGQKKDSSESFRHVN